MVRPFDVQQMLGAPGAVVIPFRAAHIKRMDMSEGARLTTMAQSDYMECAYAMEHSPLAWTVVYGSQIACSFWLTMLWDGVCEAALIPDMSVLHKPVVFTRSTRRFFDRIGPALHLKRMQVTVSTERPEAIRWAECLGFEREGIMRRFGPAGDDHYMYARIY